MEHADQRGLMRKEAVKTGPAPLGLPFSPAVKFGDLLFVSGQGPIDKTGKVIPGDIRTQTNATLENFRESLKPQGPVWTWSPRLQSTSRMLLIILRLTRPTP